ncbi:MAG: MFS transporter [Nitrospinota bacterium]
MNQSTAEMTEPRYGWVMVAVAGTFMAMAVGSMSSLAVFMKPLSAGMGWLRGETSFAYMGAALVLGGGGILAGHLSDRYSARPVVLAGAALLGVSYFLLSRQGALWQFYLFYALAGLGISSFQAPLMASVGNWFGPNKGLALGIASAWGGLGNGVVPFAAGYLISNFGWRGAYAWLGIFALAVLVPLALLVRKAPSREGAPSSSGQDAPSAPGESYPVAPWVTTAWLGAAAIFCCLCMATPLIHVVPLALDRGIGPQEAAGILLLLSVGSFLGRIVYGRIADHIGGLRTYILASMAQSVLVFWFTQVASLGGFYVLAFLYGLLYSGVMICLVICVREFVPMQRRGVSTGFVFFCAWVGMGLGGYQAGLFFDWTGDYTVSFANAALAGLINLAILFSLRRHIARKEFALAEGLVAG